MPREKWSKDRIIDEILALYRRGEELNALHVKKIHPKLFHVSYEKKYFGNWKNAVIAAGLDYDEIEKLGKKKSADKRVKWTKEKIIQEILNLHTKGENLYDSYMRKNHSALHSAAIEPRYFGSWKKAVEAAGLDYSKIKIRDFTVIKWTDDKIVREIIKLHGEREDLTASNIRKNYSKLKSAAESKRHFGSWKNAIKAAGLDYDEIKARVSWNDELIISKIRELHEAGRNLQHSVIEKEEKALHSAAVRAFGSWRDAVFAVGINYDEFRMRKAPYYWTKEKIVNEILTLHKQGGDLSYSNMKGKYQYLVVAAAKPRLFGSWKNAVESAGFDYASFIKPAPVRIWTKKKIIETIQELLDAGEDLSITNIQKNYPKLGIAANPNKFGSWKAAIEAAGLNYDEINKYADRTSWNEDLIIKTICELHSKGEDLSSSYQQAHNSGLVDAAADRFGSWGDAIQAAGLDYDKIRKDMKTEFYKGRLFEKYAEKIFEIIGLKVKHGERFVFDNETCVPDFVDMQTGEWIDVKLNSWNTGIAASAYKYLKYTDRLVIYYLCGEPRKWYQNKVVFKCIKDFYPHLKKLRQENIIGDLTLLEKGIVPSKHQKELEEYLSKEI